MSGRCATGLVYLAPGKALTATDIERALGIKHGAVLIHAATSGATVAPPFEGSLLVIDLSSSPGETAPPTPGSIAHRDVIVVLGQQSSLPGAWLDIVRDPSVRVLRVSTHYDKIHPHVVMALRARVTGMRDQLLKAVVAQRRTLFANLEQFVLAILDDPWGIRSPQDLATSVGVSTEDLDRRLPARVSRPEHFITLVRWLAFEHLIGPLRVRPRQALALVGMRDRSNLRRQWRRAEYLLRHTKSA